jgi:hypothetical protein
MIEKVKLSRVSHMQKDKEGNPLKTKDGKPYERCLLDLVDGRKVSGFGNPTSRTWNAGDEVEIEIEQKGEYWNFKVPNKEVGGAVNQEQMDRIEKMLKEIHSHLIKEEAGYPELSGEVPF